MDNCCFPRVKAARTPPQSILLFSSLSGWAGLSSKHTRKNVLGSSSSSNKVSATSVPLTPRSKGEILSDMKSFTFNELRTATRNFRPASVLGEGGFGLVFKGWIDEHTFAPARPGTGLVIAVKKLNQEGLQGHKEWLAEINYLGQFRHPNLVKLIGYCLEDEQRLLVYEFMKLGSLENHLFRSNSDFKPLSWNLRMKVALGAARGLAFLHSGPTKVIYRDFKASNVLLDSDYNAKLSDFGLAKNGPVGDESHVSTRIMGTHGYAAPEYLATGHLTVRSDVYSFGVVLLEILTGRHALDNDRPSRERSLVKWATPALASKQMVLKILDARLDGKFSVEGACRAAEVARQCLLEAKYRPTMEEVVKVLGELQDAKDIGRRPQNRQRGSGQSSENRRSSGDGNFASPRPPASPL